MIYSQLVAKVEEFAKPYCEQYQEDATLWKNHVQLVRQFAVRLAEAEGIDRQAVEIAALLHDIGKFKGRKGHHIRSHELAKEFLATTTLPIADQELILECVLKHGTGYADEENRIEVRVIQSADVLGTLFDEEWQEHSRKTMPREALLELYEKGLRKITLESAKKLAEPEVAKLKVLLA